MRKGISKMANFFDIKARKEAAATNNSSIKPSCSELNSHLQPWVEKYRPRSLNDVTAQEHTINVLQRNLQSSNLPHMLFYGPPGTGKTSTVLALAKELFGPELYRTRVLELNASDERGISIVRSKIKDFARMQLSQASASYRALYPCPPFKIIILDEADSMTQDAQSALRRTMETYSRITRFCLICNYVTRIIDPLASRCSKFRFKMLSPSGAKDRIEDIATKEGVVLEIGASETLVRCAEGDLRKAITYLQSASRLMGSIPPKTSVEDTSNTDIEKLDKSDSVTVKTIEEIAGVIPDELIKRLVQAMQPKSKKATYSAIAGVVTDLIADGWSGTQVISQLFQVILNDELIADLKKNKIALIFSEIDKRLIDGSDEHLSILDLTLRISNVLSG
ncbi:Replication factor C subunit 2 [Golovinomyces cichoracearum]|uniref:Replication factor C subunit 2 n=1 Tax=Golovinomyces cichoracearum TaxID=62708 RepID=A0A420I7W7_9PEZI|nr:Replication factor C subunit 2 [Golovinomyces cichoracearum]